MSILANLFRRPSPQTPPPGDPFLGTSGSNHDDTDTAAHPAAGYPHHYRPLDHPLPTGEPNKADELLWLETQVGRLAAAGAIDAGTSTVLDGMISSRLTQWQQAILAAADKREKLGQGIYAAQHHYLTVARAELADARTKLANLHKENDHLTTLLTYQPPHHHTD